MGRAVATDVYRSASETTRVAAWVFRLTVSRAARKVDNMIQTMASQNRVPLAGGLATMTSVSVLSLEGVWDILSR